MKYNFDLELVNSNSLLLILEQIRKGTVILEFGPANGRMTKYLKEQLTCKIYLVEIDEEAGKEALKYGEDLIIGDIENFEWFERYQNIKFDYIIFADVLEHLRNPQKVMAKSKMLLKNEGSILLSVPNFAHNAILINLINNDFQYRETGLLDNTHIHMFTKNSLENMLHDIELFPVKRMATYSQVGKNEIPADIHWNKGIDDSVWNTRKYGEVYQFVYEVKKGKEFIEEEINTLKNTLNHYYVQLYMDTGDGLSEEMSIKKVISQFDNENIFLFELYDKVDRFRIDPVNHKGLLKLICYAVIDGNKIEIETTSTNAKIERNGIYCFTDNDPWMFFDNKEGVKNLEVHIMYYSLKEEVINNIILFKDDTEYKTKIEALNLAAEKQNKKYIQEKEVLENEHKKLDLKIIQLENEKIQLTEQIYELVESRKKLENKFLYKMYKKIFRN